MTEITLVRVRTQYEGKFGPNLAKVFTPIALLAIQIRGEKRVSLEDIVPVMTLALTEVLWRPSSWSQLFICFFNRKKIDIINIKLN